MRGIRCKRNNRGQTTIYIHPCVVIAQARHRPYSAAPRCPPHPPLERGRDLRLKPAATKPVVAVGRRPDTVHRLLVHVRLEQRPEGFAPPVLSSGKPQVLIVRSDQPVAPPIAVGVGARCLPAGGVPLCGIQLGMHAHGERAGGGGGGGPSSSDRATVGAA
jgi:hypothetical protein